MKVLIVLTMFVMSICSTDYIAKGAKETSVNDHIVARRCLSNGACLSIAATAIAYNAASLYLLIKVV